MPYLQNLWVNFPALYEATQHETEYLNKLLKCLNTGGNAVLEYSSGDRGVLVLLLGLLAWQGEIERNLSQLKIQPEADQLKTVLRRLFHDFDDFFDEDEMATPKIVFATQNSEKMTRVLKILREESSYSPRAQIFVDADAGDSPPELFSREFIEGDAIHTTFYFSSGVRFEDADVIIMPYSFLLGRNVLARRKNNPISGNILVLDDAQEIDQICEDEFSYEFDFFEISACQKVIDEFTDRSVASSDAHQIPVVILHSLGGLFFKVQEHFAKYEALRRSGVVKLGVEIFGMLAEFGIGSAADARRTVTKIETFLACFGDGGGPVESAPVLRRFSKMLNTMYPDAKHKGKAICENYKIILQSTRDVEKTTPKWKVTFYCCSSGFISEKLQSLGVRSLVLAGESLAPVDSFETKMNMVFAFKHENCSVVEPDRVFISTLSTGPCGSVLVNAGAKMQRRRYLVEVGNSVTNVAKITLGGVLVFLPSRAWMDELVAVWKDEGILDRITDVKKIFTESADSDENGRTVEEFYEVVKNDSRGAMFLMDANGKTHKNFDYEDDNARAVIFAGVPFPDDRIPRNVAKQQFIDEARFRRVGFDRTAMTSWDWMQDEAVRRINRIVTKLIARENDHAAIILPERQFTTKKILDSLPLRVRQHVRHSDRFGQIFGAMKQFFKSREPRKEKEPPAKRKQSELSLEETSDAKKLDGAKIQSRSDRAVTRSRRPADIKAASNKNSEMNSDEPSVSSNKASHDFTVLLEETSDAPYTSKDPVERKKLDGAKIPSRSARAVTRSRRPADIKAASNRKSDEMNSKEPNVSSNKASHDPTVRQSPIATPSPTPSSEIRSGLKTCDRVGAADRREDLFPDLNDAEIRSLCQAAMTRARDKNFLYYYFKRIAAEDEDQVDRYKKILVKYMDSGDLDTLVSEMSELLLQKGPRYPELFRYLWVHVERLQKKPFSHICEKLTGEKVCIGILLKDILFMEGQMSEVDRLSALTQLPHL